MSADLLILPGESSANGLAVGEDALIQDFLLAMLNYGYDRPYLPSSKILPITAVLLSGGNVPTLASIALAFNLSLNSLKALMLVSNPTYTGAQLLSIDNTSVRGEVALTIEITTTSTSVLITKSWRFG